MFSGNEFQNPKPPSSIKLTNWPMTICASLKRFFFDRDLKEDNVDNIFLHKYKKYTQKTNTLCMYMLLSFVVYIVFTKICLIDHLLYTR